ncbi:hypothetical protein RSAG8_12222, partial [Rhizoctonia solani AG-8 WAC10335]
MSLTTSCKKGYQRNEDIYLAAESTIVATPVSNVQTLSDVRRKLKNSHQREKRAKARVAEQTSELASIKERLHEQEIVAKSNSEQTSNLARTAQVQISALQQAEICLQERVESSQTSIEALEEQLDSMQLSNARLGHSLTDTTAKLDTKQQELNRLLTRNNRLEHSHEALRKRRARGKVTTPSSKFTQMSNSLLIHRLRLKSPSGAILPEVRDLLRQLSSDGVSTERALSVISHVVSAFGFTLEDSISARSVSRANLEGLLQSQMQIAFEINQAECLTICGDGTTIKNQQHEAKLIHIPTPSTDPVQPPPLRTLGVHKSPSHTAKAQLEGWKRAVDICCQLLSQSPLGHALAISSRHFAAKLSGMLTDHASDQKLLAELVRAWKTQSDWELHGEAILNQMSSEERALALSKYLEQACQSIGQWETLSADKQSQLTHDAWAALALAAGESAFKDLPEDEQEAAKLFVWTGCCMHKELNAVKGGVVKMSVEWENLNLTPPIALKNKFEVTQQTQNKSTKETSITPGHGGMKLTSLAGALFNHRDDKRGQQDTYRYFFEHRLGHLPKFPDTSNTRYGSHCDAAAELLLHLDTYLDFLRDIRDAKASPGFTNIELNLYNGLNDPATLTELAVMALYVQAVGLPYMRYVRGSAQNALELGPFHEKVKSHCKALMGDFALLALPSTGTLDGKPWGSPDIVDHITSMSKTMPHIREMWAAFLQGALKTWERFTLEFGAETPLGNHPSVFGSTGAYGKATPEQRSRIWNNPTNDASEGALGQCRQIRAEQNEAFVKRANEGRARQVKTSTRRVRLAQQQRLAGITVLINATYEELKQLTIRERDKSMPPKSKLGTKKVKIMEILRALEHRGDLPSDTGGGERLGGANTGIHEAAMLCDPAGEEFPDEEAAECFDEEMPPDEAMVEYDPEWVY